MENCPFIVDLPIKNGDFLVGFFMPLAIRGMSSPPSIPTLRCHERWLGNPELPGLVNIQETDGKITIFNGYPLVI